jgi:hypothetical protein
MNLDQETTSIKFSSLPKEVLREIPYSMRSIKDEWKKDELPYDILHLLESYFVRTPTIKYRQVFDIKPTISKYGDFVVVGSRKNLVLEYLKNYFQIGINAYPFDPTFYCPLKMYLQDKNTDTVNTFIEYELISICRLITSDLHFPINVLSTNINKSTESTGSTSYEITINLSIDGEEDQLVLIS